ncbi:MAG: hypothetical protein IKB70_07460 [Bacilli bacterium]|nr:hypothetical protein [Bacilli bacterium]
MIRTEKIKEYDLTYMFKDIEKKVKGYGYDSLCLRYNIARDAQAEYEIRYKHKDPENAYKLAERDKMRFYNILHDLIGEHD